jgi:hypothetical protein
MQRYAEGHGLKTKFYSQATFNEIRNEINRGALIALSSNVLPAGHIFLVKGYSGNNLVYVNDPWGNFNLQNYGRLYNGANCTYNFDNIKPKHMVSIFN